MTPAQSVETLLRWCGQGGEAHKLMAVLACAARHECDDLEPDGPHEFIELDASIADTLNDLLGDLRDVSALQSIPEPLLDEGLAQYLGEAVGEALREAEHKGDGCDFTEVIRAALSIPRLEAGRVTEAMIEAGVESACIETGEYLRPESIKAIYLAMSSASAPDGEDR